MTSQILKTPISSNILFEMLEKICSKTKTHYILNKIAFKKCEFLSLIRPFCDDIIGYYHNSKKFYINRKQTYGTFITLVRQICRAGDINYSSKIKYNKSSYDIVYNIYF